MFTEQGVAVLATVLNSERAIQVTIAIMRTFVRLRQMLISNACLARKLNALEKKYNSQYKMVFDAIRQLMAPPGKPKRRIGLSIKKISEVSLASHGELHYPGKMEKRLTMSLMITCREHIGLYTAEKPGMPE